MTRRDDFIQNVFDFDSLTQFPPSAVNIIKTQYLSQPNFTHKSVEYASRACGNSLCLLRFLSTNITIGPLMLWLEAQIQFGEVMTQNAPLMEKLRKLQEEYNKLLKKCDELVAPPPIPSSPPYVLTRLAGIVN